MVRTKHYLLVQLLLALLSINGCSTCHEIQINSISDGTWDADLRYRTCGSYSGYSVGIYRSDEPHAKSGDGENEPFQALYATENHNVNNVPINLLWESDNHLTIRHDTRVSLDDNESKLMVLKAEKYYQDVVIEYIPEPVLWGKNYHELK